MLSDWKLSYPILQRLRWTIHIAGVVILTSVGYVGWHLRCSIQEWHARMEQEIEQDTELLENTAKIQEQLDDALSNRDSASASFRALRERVPIRLVDSEILSELEKVVAACDCKLNDFRPISNQVIETKELKCKVRSFHLSMNGSYKGLFAFARDLDQLPFLVQLKRLQLLAPSDNKPSCFIELELGILYSPEWGDSELVYVDRT